MISGRQWLVCASRRNLWPLYQAFSSWRFAGPGLMQPDLEALLASDLVEAAATQSAPIRGDWELMVSAVRKVATGGGGKAPSYPIADQSSSLWRSVHQGLVPVRQTTRDRPSRICPPTQPRARKSGHYDCRTEDTDTYSHGYPASMPKPGIAARLSWHRAECRRLRTLLFRRNRPHGDRRLA